MLHSLRMSKARGAAIWKAAVGPALLIMAIAVTGLRPLPAAAQQDESQQAPARGAIADPVQLMALLEVTAIIDVDIEQLRQSPQVKPLLAQWPPQVVEQFEKLLGAPLEKVQRVTIGFSNPSPSMPLGRYAGHVVTYMDEETSSVGGLKFREMELRNQPPADSLAGRLMQFDPSGNDAQRPVRVAFDMAALRPAFQALLKESRDQGGPTMAGLEPLLVDVDSVLLRATAEQILKVDGRVDCRSPEAAERVAEMLVAVRGLAAPILRKEFGQDLDRRTRIMVTSLVSAGRRLVESLEFTPRNATVTLRGQVDAPQMAMLISMALPAIMEAQEAQSIQNLKQLGLAFHNYHDTHGHFPPAEVEGPGGVKRSWRVELLPFLDAAALYERYRKDEPWDSENNLQVLKEMPPAFRHPSHWAGSTDTAYLTIVGEGTALSGKEPQFRDFTDGVSNTILVVEANRGVPWTKPEDLPFDPEAILAGGLVPAEIVILLGDGWAGKLSGELSPDVLRKMITRAGGEPRR